MPNIAYTLVHPNFGAQAHGIFNINEMPNDPLHQEVLLRMENKRSENNSVVMVSLLEKDLRRILAEPKLTPPVMVDHQVVFGVRLF